MRTTKDCKVLQDHLNHLVKIGHLKEFLALNQVLKSNSQGFEQPRGSHASLGMIKVIHVAQTRDPLKESRVMAMTSQVEMGSSSKVGKRKRDEQEVIIGSPIRIKKARFNHTMMHW